MRVAADSSLAPALLHYEMCGAGSSSYDDVLVLGHDHAPDHHHRTHGRQADRVSHARGGDKAKGGAADARGAQSRATVGRNCMAGLSAELHLLSHA